MSRELSDSEAQEHQTAYDLFMVASEAMQRGEFEVAIEKFQESAILSSHYKTLQLLGECLKKVGRLNEAIVALAAATTLNRQGIAPTILAGIFYEKGDWAMAKEMVQIALQRQPRYNQAISLLLKIETAMEGTDTDS
jgi:tetratricopeptide (TPR) repeat protein